MNRMNINYISGGIELLDEIQPLWDKLNRHHQTISPHFSVEFGTKTFDGRKEKLLKKYAGSEIRIDLAQSNDRIIGYLISAITLDGVGEIELVYIEDSFRGQLIGDELMHRALNWLDGQKVHTKVIAVAVGNERAFSFYARFGFFPRVVKLEQK